MQDFPLNPIEMGESLWRNKYLLKKSIQREVVGRYRGSVLGMLWSFFQPMFMLVVYTFVFSVVFKAKWHGGSDSKTEFALILFAGLMVFNLFAECVNRAPYLILSNVNYVKKVIYPLEILPWVALGSAVFNAAVSFIVWLVAYTLLIGVPSITIILYPIVIAPLVLFTVGICYWLASLGVYLRDVAQVINILTTALLFLSPIFYSPKNLPPTYQKILYCNPMTSVIQNVREILLWGALPHLGILIIQYLVAGLVCALGFAWFQKTRKGFADVL